MDFRGRTPSRSRARVWRVTAGAPKGGWVDLVTSPPAIVDAPERASTTWAMSSFDLRYGADITDVSDTLPADLLDELFPPKKDPPKRSGM
jgi:hypothetical protein